MMVQTSRASIRAKMEEMRLDCDREISIQHQKMELASLAFRKSLDSIKCNANETVQNQGKILKLKSQLRLAEDDLVKALAAKTRKEAKKMATSGSIVSTKARIEKLKEIVEDQRARKDENATIIHHQSKLLTECEEKQSKDSECRGEIEEAISWYNTVLGFRIECGRGVKFAFTKINPKNPKEEYFFTIRHENDIYSMLDCHPQVSDTKELIQDLNTSNGLFNFVRIMRKKFQEAATSGNFVQTSSHVQEASTISISGPESLVSTDSRYKSPVKRTLFQQGETNKSPIKDYHGKGPKAAIRSPGSASRRKSPRFKVKK